MILRRALLLIAIGLAVGLGLAFLSGRLLAGILYGVSPSDPVALGAAVGILALVAIFAALMPARRATHIDPIVALRYE